MANQNLSNGIEELIQADDCIIKQIMINHLKPYPKKGLYAKLVSVGMNVTELNFTNAKTGRAGYKNNLKIVAALAKLPAQNKKLLRQKLHKS